MVNVRSVRALRVNRNKFTEDFTHEFPPQTTIAPNETDLTGCCERTYPGSAAATHGGGVCPSAVFERTADILT